ncbi:MAG: hypothetical protein IT442_17690 [Phycisphaeraceae bacterium]|nr:hypothetical protein [Phycisphaeraceae bacterium]
MSTNHNTNTYRIDLRSDIHSAPTPTMRQAMAQASVGGDALAGEDACLAELEQTAAEMFKKETALFVCSGTMGNLVSLLTISRPGDVLIGDPYTHVFSSERDGFRRLGGCTLAAVETDGVLTPGHVRQGVLARGLARRGAAVICTENTHALRGGVPWGADVTADLVELAREQGWRLHVDGARIFNAAVALKTSVADLVAGADTVQICLAKGLGAPVGSLILGTHAVIDQAREHRQMLGGGLHKPRIMAAAGLVALWEAPARLADDHRRAKQLGQRLTQIDVFTLAHPVYTNIVDLIFNPDALDGHQLVARAAEHGVGITGPWTCSWGQSIRLMTHHDISDADIEDAVHVIGQAVIKVNRSARRP